MMRGNVLINVEDIECAYQYYLHSFCMDYIKNRTRSKNFRFLNLDF